jgi:hypothetical protein
VYVHWVKYSMAYLSGKLNPFQTTVQKSNLFLNFSEAQFISDGQVAKEILFRN